jgi:hypothetical protein
MRGMDKKTTKKKGKKRKKKNKKRDRAYATLAQISESRRKRALPSDCLN